PVRVDTMGRWLASASKAARSQAGFGSKPKQPSARLNEIKCICQPTSCPRSITDRQNDSRAKKPESSVPVQKRTLSSQRINQVIGGSFAPNDSTIRSSNRRHAQISVPLDGFAKTPGRTGSTSQPSSTF